jgi:hypothetical protein
VGARERARLDGLDGQTFGWPSGGWTSGRWPDGAAGEPGASGLPVGLRLLSLIRSPAWRVATGVGTVSLAAGLYLAKPALGLVAGALLVALLLPHGLTRRW